MNTQTTNEVSVPAQKLPSLASFNATKLGEKPYTFEYINEHGEGTGWMIDVVGDQTERVKKAAYAKINRDRVQAEMLKRKGKNEPVKPIEDLILENIEGVAACIVGWSGIEEEYSIELAIQAVQNNRSVFEQVKEASENLANFTESK